jgi:hypothetical protein
VAECHHDGENQPRKWAGGCALRVAKRGLEAKQKQETACVRRDHRVKEEDEAVASPSSDSGRSSTRKKCAGVITFLDRQQELVAGWVGCWPQQRAETNDHGWPAMPWWWQGDAPMTSEAGDDLGK